MGDLTTAFTARVASAIVGSQGGQITSTCDNEVPVESRRNRELGLEVARNQLNSVQSNSLTKHLSGSLPECTSCHRMMMGKYRRCEDGSRVRPEEGMRLVEAPNRVKQIARLGANSLH